MRLSTDYPLRSVDSQQISIGCRGIRQISGRYHLMISQHPQASNKTKGVYTPTPYNQIQALLKIYKQD
ncbi:hypothetical protein BDW66DRAFT_130969 [Aspergillus desertorum]